MARAKVKHPVGYILEIIIVSLAIYALTECVEAAVHALIDRFDGFPLYSKIVLSFVCAGLLSVKIQRALRPWEERISEWMETRREIRLTIKQFGEKMKRMKKKRTSELIQSKANDAIPSSLRCIEAVTAGRVLLSHPLDIEWWLKEIADRSNAVLEIYVIDSYTEFPNIGSDSYVGIVNYARLLSRLRKKHNMIHILVPTQKDNIPSCEAEGMFILKQAAEASAYSDVVYLAAEDFPQQITPFVKQDKSILIINSEQGKHHYAELSGLWGASTTFGDSFLEFERGPQIPNLRGLLATFSSNNPNFKTVKPHDFNMVQDLLKEQHHQELIREVIPIWLNTSNHEAFSLDTRLLDNNLMYWERDLFYLMTLHINEAMIEEPNGILFSRIFIVRDYGKNALMHNALVEKVLTDHIESGVKVGIIFEDLLAAAVQNKEFDMAALDMNYIPDFSCIWHCANAKEGTCFHLWQLDRDWDSGKSQYERRYPEERVPVSDDQRFVTRVVGRHTGDKYIRMIDIIKAEYMSFESYKNVLMDIIGRMENSSSAPMKIGWVCKDDFNWKTKLHRILPN